MLKTRSTLCCGFFSALPQMGTMLIKVGETNRKLIFAICQSMSRCINICYIAKK